MENNHSELLPSTTILLIKIMWKTMFFLTMTPYGQLLITTLLQISLLQQILAQEDTTINTILLTLSGIITIGDLQIIKRRRNNKIREQKEQQEQKELQHAIDIQHQVEVLQRTANYHHNKKNYNNLLKTVKQGETIMEINELTNRTLLTEYEDALNDCSDHKEKDLYNELLKRMEYSKYSVS